MSELAIVDNLGINDAHNPIDELTLRQAFASQLKGPEAVQEFMDSLNLHSPAASPPPYHPSFSGTQTRLHPFQWKRRLATAMAPLS